MTTIQMIEAIGTDPDIRSGRPYLVGTTVTVADVAIIRLYHGLDAEGIADWYGLSLPQTYAALAYYYDHKASIDASIQARRELAAQMKEQRVGSRHPPLFR